MTLVRGSAPFDRAACHRRPASRRAHITTWSVRPSRSGWPPTCPAPTSTMRSPAYSRAWLMADSTPSVTKVYGATPFQPLVSSKSRRPVTTAATSGYELKKKSREPLPNQSNGGPGWWMVEFVPEDVAAGFTALACVPASRVPGCPSRRDRRRAPRRPASTVVPRESPRPTPCHAGAGTSGRRSHVPLMLER